MNKSRQSGFTLVEIAIVLVIIGLLLGGILKGQELINSARVRNMADQNSAIQAAYYGFIDRYRQVPGDMDKDKAEQAIGQTINDGGNSNGRIDEDSWPEAGAVWEHLSKSGFITGFYDGGATGPSNYEEVDVAPINAFNGYILLSRIKGADYVGSGGDRLAYVFGKQVPVNIMRELDVKLDDGRADSGVVRATAATTTHTTVTQAAADCVDTSDESIWNIEDASQDCNGTYLY